MRDEAEQFAAVNNLSQLINLPTHMPDRTVDRAPTLDPNPTVYYFPWAHRNIVLLHYPSTSPTIILHPPQDTYFGAAFQPTETISATF